MTTRSLASTRAVIRKHFAAPRERLFQMWTEAEHLCRWFFPGSAAHATPHVQVDLRVGGRYCITRYAPDGTITAMVGGTYHEVQPPVKLMFSWTWEAHAPDTSETLVTVEFLDVDGATELVITHERIPAFTGQEEHTIGWVCCLERLAQLVEAASLHPILAIDTDPCRR